MTIEPIAIFHSPFPTKFGIPKQSGLVEELKGRVVFNAEYRNPDYIRGIEGFDRLWFIWEFSANRHTAVSPLVRPPVLGGNEKRGVFATRSPFRPNPIGLSCVKLDRVEFNTPDGPILHISGADLMDGTPIYDIKPYVPYADAFPDTKAGFVDSTPIKRLKVVIPEEFSKRYSPEELTALRKTLELDPRPHYHNDPNKIYGMPFMNDDIHFSVHGEELVIMN